MSGRHFLADRDELSGWISFNASQKKGCWGRCGGKEESPDRHGMWAPCWGGPGRAPAIQGTHKAPGPPPRSPTVSRARWAEGPQRSQAWPALRALKVS